MYVTLVYVFCLVMIPTLVSTYIVLMHGTQLAVHAVYLPFILYIGHLHIFPGNQHLVTGIYCTHKFCTHTGQIKYYENDIFIYIPPPDNALNICLFEKILLIEFMSLKEFYNLDLLPREYLNLKNSLL